MNMEPKTKATLYCLFLGFLGIHRFYLGYTLIGIIQFLTGGGLMIWVLIDLIRLITGSLGPKDSGWDWRWSELKWYCTENEFMK
jgi:TM2 domain-containing membrane protein YozV